MKNKITYTKKASEVTMELPYMTDSTGASDCP